MRPDNVQKNFQICILSRCQHPDFWLGFKTEKTADEAFAALQKEFLDYKLANFFLKRSTQTAYSKS